MRPTDHRIFSKLLPRIPGPGWSDLPRWLRLLTAFAVLNFIAFVLIAQVSGGDAWNGHIKDGKYFLASHGRYTEVSHGFWTYSFIHIVVLMVVQISAMVAGFSYWIYWLYMNRDESSVDGDENEQRF